MDHQWLSGLGANLRIAVKVEPGLSSRREIDCMSDAMYIFVASCSQEVFEHRSHTQGTPIGREAVACTLHGAGEHLAQPLEGWTIGKAAVVAFRETKDTAGLRDAETFLQQHRPLGAREHADEETRVHQIKGVIREIQGLTHIHNPK